MEYTYLFHEKDGLHTLTTLCGDCHDITHGRIPENRVLSDSVLDALILKWIEE